LKLGLNDMTIRGYKVTARILNICINWIEGDTKHTRAISTKRVAYFVTV